MNESENGYFCFPKNIDPFFINADNFWDTVDIKKGNECWTWKGGINGKGYGYICAPRKTGVSRRIYLTHRIAWTLKNGEIKRGMLVCHACDNPPCCNPAHLFIGTHADNAVDKVRKGRQAKGETSGHRLHPEIVMHGIKHPLAKLDDNKVREIRIKRSGGLSLDHLSAEYGVCRAKIDQICHRKSWKHVP